MNILYFNVFELGTAGNITIKERPFNVGKKANWFEGTPQGGIGREE